MQKSDAKGTEKEQAIQRQSVADILSHVRPTPFVANGRSAEQKVTEITACMRQVMEVLGLDLTNDSLARTPERIARMYVNELFSGLDPEAFPKITTIRNEMGYDQMILLRDISVMSVCEHHFATIDGTATVAYIPRERVIGLSKINRIVRFFSRRPQVQERLTKQIADCLAYVLLTDDIAVHIEARHFCVVARGIEDRNTITITSDLRGAFRNLATTRSEFLNSIDKSFKR